MVSTKNHSTDWLTFQTFSYNTKITISLNMDALNSKVLKDILTEAKVVVLSLPAKSDTEIPNLAQVYIRTAEFAVDLGSVWRLGKGSSLVYDQ